MNLGIGGAEIRLMKQFLEERLDKTKSKDYKEGYFEALEEFSGLLLCRIEEKIEYEFMRMEGEE